VNTRSFIKQKKEPSFNCPWIEIVAAERAWVELLPALQWEWGPFIRQVVSTRGGPIKPT